MANWKWSGPVTAAAGAAAITLFLMGHPPSDDPVSAWLVWSALTVSWVLPLAGLGMGLSLVSLPLVLIGCLIFLSGFFAGLMNYNSVWIWFAAVPDSSGHLYLTLPVSSFFSGLLLISPDAGRRWLVLPAAAVVGAMLAITVKLTDPTLHDPIIPKLGLFVGIWVILSVMLSVRFFYRPWFPVPIRIFGSWLLAASLLYGGTALSVKYGAVTPKTIPKEAPNTNSAPDEELLIPDFTRSGSSTTLDKKGLRA